jgi:hypothetical protein
MKQYIIALILLLSAGVNTIKGMCSNECNICAHTTFVPRTMAQNSVLELALHNYYQYHLPCCDGECPPWVSLEVTAPYYFKSTKSDRLARYFLPKCQECVTVGQNNTSDISSLWLSIAAPIDTPFESTICIEPKRTVIGGAFKLFFDFGTYDSCYCGWWASIFVPIQQVRHDLNIVETSTGGTPIVPPSFPDVISALNNPDWLYGKLSPNKLKRTGVDDICVKLGYDFVRNEDMHSGIYGLLFIPTGRGTKAEYLFEPLVGTKHVGLGLGFNGDYELYDCDVTSLDLMIDARYAYFLKHKERRSIDLFNGDWSRYMQVVEPTDTGTPLSAINFLSPEVDVTPRSMFEVWAALSFNHCNFHFEVGYDFWLRSKEKISLPDQDFGVGIYDIAFDPTFACPVTAHCARICQSVPTLADAPVSDTEFISIKNSNALNDSFESCNTGCSTGLNNADATRCSYFNLDSAAAPKALSSTIYGAISYDCCLCCEYPVMIGVGGQYEFAHRTSALSQYGVWLKTAITF